MIPRVYGTTAGGGTRHYSALPGHHLRRGPCSLQNHGARPHDSIRASHKGGRESTSGGAELNKTAPSCRPALEHTKCAPKVGTHPLETSPSTTGTAGVSTIDHLSIPCGSSKGPRCEGTWTQGAGPCAGAGSRHTQSDTGLGWLHPISENREAGIAGPRSLARLHCKTAVVSRGNKTERTRSYRTKLRRTRSDQSSVRLGRL